MTYGKHTKDQPTQTPDAPLYLRLVGQLRRDLLGGRYPPGSRLPSEEELGQQHSMSRHTVREALRRLREDGLVASRKGAGTIVLSPKDAARYVHEIASVEQLLEYGADIPLTVSISKPVVADRALAQRLDCCKGDEWMLIAGLRRRPGQALPICWTEVYLRAEYADVPFVIGETVGPIYTGIEKRHGQVITNIEQSLTALAIPARVAAKLGVPAGSPGVEVRRTFRIGSGKVGQVAINLHPAKGFRYSIELRRAQTL